MVRVRRLCRWRLVAVLGGALLGAGMGVGVGITAVRAAADGQPEALPPILEATHLPPLLTVRGEPVEVRYDVFCAPAGAAEDLVTDAPCEASGTVFARAGDSGPFAPLPLRDEAAAAEGRYVASLPRAIANSPRGFSYYATFRSSLTGSEISLPEGGAASPERSMPLGRSVDVHLGPHAFGEVRKPDAVVGSAAWGDGPDQVGLEQGRNLTPIGGSSFAVDSAGNVSVLDEAHKRLLHWTGAGGPASVPLAVAGTLADLALADDGTIFVLESTSPSSRPVLREFDARGSQLASVQTAERASQVRLGPEGPVLLEEPSNQWAEAARNGRLLPADEQRRTGRSARPLRSGGGVIVLRRGNEIRVALTAERGVLRSWRVTSETPVAEVQLAEPRGNELVLVARVYDDDRDQFVVLVLGNQGLVDSFSLDAADWAETSPLSRFRLVGSSLFQLGSTPSALFVDRFDLAAR